MTQSLKQLNISMHFVNNTAGTAGDALYGGYVDTCIWTRHWSPFYDVTHTFKYVDLPNSHGVGIFLVGGWNI